jgi:hypothetical protein
MRGDADAFPDFDSDYLNHVASGPPAEDISQDPEDWPRVAERLEPHARSTERLAGSTPGALRDSLRSVLSEKAGTAAIALRALALLEGFEDATPTEQGETLHELLRVFLHDRVTTGRRTWNAAHLMCIRLRTAHRAEKLDQ